MHRAGDNEAIETQEALMRSIVAAIARACRAFARAAKAAVKKTVLIAGRLVTVFLPAPMPFVDELEPDIVEPANDNVAASAEQPIRDLAMANLLGRMPSAQQLGAVTQLQADWLASLDREMCSRVAVAKDVDIKAHVLGYRNIRGVIPCDPDAINDLVLAREMDNARMEEVLGLNGPRVAKMPGGM